MLSLLGSSIAPNARQATSKIRGMSASSAGRTLTGMLFDLLKNDVFLMVFERGEVMSLFGQEKVDLGCDVVVAWASCRSDPPHVADIDFQRFEKGGRS
jgi:hypothetical protein